MAGKEAHSTKCHITNKSKKFRKKELANALFECDTDVGSLDEKIKDCNLNVAVESSDGTSEVEVLLFSADDGSQAKIQEFSNDSREAEVQRYSHESSKAEDQESSDDNSEAQVQQNSDCSGEAEVQQYSDDSSEA